MKKAINRKVTSLALCGVLSFGLTVAPMAHHSEAFGVLNAIGAIVGVSAQQIALNQQIDYFDHCLDIHYQYCDHQ